MEWLTPLFNTTIKKCCESLFPGASTRTNLQYSALLGVTVDRNSMYISSMECFNTADSLTPVKYNIRPLTDVDRIKKTFESVLCELCKHKIPSAASVCIEGTLFILLDKEVISVSLSKEIEGMAKDVSRDLTVQMSPNVVVVANDQPEPCPGEETISVKKKMITEETVTNLETEQQIIGENVEVDISLDQQEEQQEDHQYSKVEQMEMTSLPENILDEDDEGDSIDNTVVMVTESEMNEPIQGAIIAVKDMDSADMASDKLVEVVSTPEGTDDSQPDIGGFNLTSLVANCVNENIASNNTGTSDVISIITTEDLSDSVVSKVVEEINNFDQKQTANIVEEINNFDHKQTRFFSDSVSCDICGKYVRKSNLKRHKKSHKGGEYACNLCDKTFHYELELERHLKKHSGEKDFVCKECGKAFYLEKSLIEHFRISHDEGENFRCHVCDLEFSDQKSLRLHRSVHIEKHQCDKCSMVFKYKSLVERHKANVHSPREEQVCDQCGQIYKNLLYLKAHRRRCHFNQNEFPCDYCQKVFNDKSTLKKHTRIHTDERNFVCDICGSKFIQSSSLHSHKRTHTNIRPFKCTHCDKTFQTNSNLTAHVQTHGTVKAYQCPQCDLSFKTAGGLYHHKILHSDRQYQCFCGKIFKECHRLNNHVKQKHKNEDSGNFVYEQVEEVKIDSLYAEIPE